MTAFRHSDPSPAEAAWFASPLAAATVLDAPREGDQVLVVAAHPDDETLGAGGLIATAHARGAKVTVVVATDGEASHPNSPTHTPGDLARRRRCEVLDAVTRLAPGVGVHFLGLPDGGLDDVVDTLTAKLAEYAATAGLLVCPWEGDRHPDHAACARAVGTLARRLQLPRWSYPIWMWHWAAPDDDGLPWDRIGRLPLAPSHLIAKQRAIACHSSQHGALSDRPGDEPILSPEMLAHFGRPFETFVVDDDPATSAEYFDSLYGAADDPWKLADRFYERRKRAALLASLPRERFRRAFEPGCAAGLLTEQLGRRCDELVAWDVAERAVALTTERVAGSDNVRVGRGRIPDDWPDGEFDLVVLSEVGYYCTDLDALVAATRAALADDGVVVGCHWRHRARQHVHSGDAVHRALAACGELVVDHVEADFLLQVWTRSGRSVATETGIVR